MRWRAGFSHAKACRRVTWSRSSDAVVNFQPSADRRQGPRHSPFTRATSRVARSSLLVRERGKLLQAIVLFNQPLLVWHLFNASNGGTNAAKPPLRVIDLASDCIGGWPGAASAGESTYELTFVGSILQPCRLLGLERCKKPLVHPAFPARRRRHEFEQLFMFACQARLDSVLPLHKHQPRTHRAPFGPTFRSIGAGDFGDGGER